MIATDRPLAPEVKGWCPSVLRPMTAGDGLIARIKPTAATLSADQARVVAEAADRFGNGQLEVTRRGNLQARGFDAAGHERFADIVLTCRLAVAGADAEAVRTVMAAPLSPAEDPSCTLDAHGIARAIEAALVADRALHDLPGKVGIAVDGGGALPLTAGGPVDTADITVAGAADGQAVLRLPADDAGRFAEAVVPASDAAVTAIHMLRAFLAQANPAHRRVASLLAETGPAQFLDALDLSWRWREAPETATPLGAPGLRRYGTGLAAVTAAPAFGRLPAEALAALADIAEANGDGTVRLTPWRAAVLPGIAAADAESVRRRASALGLIVDAGDPRLRVFACTGRPGCLHAGADVLADVGAFAAALPGGAMLHVSGCAKGCAYGRPAALTLTAENGRYDLVRGGRAGETPDLPGLTRDAAIAEIRRGGR